MPELPEVETVKNQLAPKITGRTITDVTLLWEKMVEGKDPAEFLRLVKGHKSWNWAVTANTSSSI